MIGVTLLAASCSGTSFSVTNASSTPGSSLSPSSPGPAGFVVYTNTSPAFTISYPASWTVKTGASGTIVAFLTSTTGATDAFAENVNVLHQTVPSGTTLKQYTDASFSGVGTVIQGFHEVSLSAGTLSGQPAETLDYTGTYGGRDMHWLAEWTVVGTDAYVLTYSAEPGSYERFLPDARTTIESFQLS